MTRACQAVGLHRATAYRHLRPPVMTCAPRRKPSHRRIPDAERASMLAVLDSERFIDQPPREVYGKLLTEGTYLCSWRTFYRLLSERAPMKEERNEFDRPLRWVWAGRGRLTGALEACGGRAEGVVCAARMCVSSENG
jgi:hypothetical protein